MIQAEADQAILEKAEMAAMEVESESDDCGLCSIKIMDALKREGAHAWLVVGQVRDLKTGVRVIPHYWVVLPGGWVVDVRLRFWLWPSDRVQCGLEVTSEDTEDPEVDTEIPHGVFKPDGERFDYSGMTYFGGEVSDGDC